MLSRIVKKEDRIKQDISQHLGQDVIDFFNNIVCNQNVLKTKKIGLYFYEQLNQCEFHKDDYGYISYERKYDEYTIYLTKNTMSLKTESIKAFIAHELGHVINGDLDLDFKLKDFIVGFIQRWIAMVIILMEIFYSFTTSLLLNTICLIALVNMSMISLFSFLNARKARKKEFLADKIALQFVSQKDLIELLQISDTIENMSKNKMTTLYLKAFSTHPLLYDRIKALDKKND